MSHEVMLSFAFKLAILYMFFYNNNDACIISVSFFEQIYGWFCQHSTWRWWCIV